MQLALRYGRNGLQVRLPGGNVQHVLRFRPLPAIEDPQAAVLAALRQPLGCMALRELAHGKGNACVVTSDITRPVPNALVLPPILRELEAAGLPAERVTLLIGTGSHRPNTPEELQEMLGEEVMRSGAQVVNHDAFDHGQLVERGVTRRGTPVRVNRRYVEADLRISVALVEPHLIAGFSGGRKAICPGICAIETLLNFHGPELIQPDEACAGLVDGNPAHEEAYEAATLAGAPELTVNVTLDEERRLTGVFAGEMDAGHRAAVAHSVAQAKVAIAEPVDIATTTSAGYPLDLTFYQGVKGIAAPLRILKPGGTIIVAHQCAEGIGEPDLVRRIMELDDFEAYVPRGWDPTYFHMDQWHAQFTKIRRQASEVLNFSEGIPRDQQARCFVTPIESVEEGVQRALHRHGPDASIAVLPEGPYVLACLSGDRIDRQEFS
jgi:nickel-dependent lactate racemase